MVLSLSNPIHPLLDSSAPKHFELCTLNVLICFCGLPTLARRSCSSDGVLSAPTLALFSSSQLFRNRAAAPTRPLLRGIGLQQVQRLSLVQKLVSFWERARVLDLRAVKVYPVSFSNPRQLTTICRCDAANKSSSSKQTRSRVAFSRSHSDACV